MHARGMVVAMAETILEQRVRRTEGHDFFSSEDVVGKRVKNPEGYDLGEISSLRVGLPTGKVAYAVRYVMANGIASTRVIFTALLNACLRARFAQVVA